MKPRMKIAAAGVQGTSATAHPQRLLLDGHDKRHGQVPKLVFEESNRKFGRVRKLNALTHAADIFSFCGE